MLQHVKTIPFTFAPVAWCMKKYTPTNKGQAPSYGAFFRPFEVNVYTKHRKMLTFVDNKLV